MEFICTVFVGFFFLVGRFMRKIQRQEIFKR